MLKCSIKFNLEDNKSDYEFNNQNDIPENITYLELYYSSFSKNHKEFNFSRFKELTELHINLNLDNIDLTENNKLRNLYIEFYNLNELKVNKDCIQKLYLYDCIITDINILKEFVNLKYLELGLTTINSETIIFPELNIQELLIDEFKDVVRVINLNNLQKLYKLTVYGTVDLKDLYIHELTELQDLIMSGVCFNNIRLC